MSPKQCPGVNSHLQERLAERFKGEAEPAFTWTEQGKAKVEVEGVTLGILES